MRGVIIAKQSGVIAGLDVARAVYWEIEQAVLFDARVRDGDRVEPRREVAEVAGKARALLTGERTALNILGRMSGIAGPVG